MIIRVITTFTEYAGNTAMNKKIIGENMIV